ncbi:MAG: disulfide bond formation protein B [Rhodospirillaceae bacterium]|nr:MAG: disulfide bond formation protein B [Rhodospirillaceae bacterium]
MATGPGPRYNPAMNPTMSTSSFSAFSTATVGSIAVVSAAALGLAFIAQYGFSLQPCELCLLQRLPYAATLVFGLMAAMPVVPPQARRQVVALCAALFAFNAALAAYHAGIEYRWWQGPTACTGHTGDFDLGDLAAALGRPGRISCEDAAFRVFGISMAGGNAIFCAALALGCAWATRRRAVWDAP